MNLNHRLTVSYNFGVLYVIYYFLCFSGMRLFDLMNTLQEKKSFLLSRGSVLLYLVLFQGLQVK